MSERACVKLGMNKMKGLGEQVKSALRGSES